MQACTLMRVHTHSFTHGEDKNVLDRQVTMLYTSTGLSNMGLEACHKSYEFCSGRTSVMAYPSTFYIVQCLPSIYLNSYYSSQLLIRIFVCHHFLEIQLSAK